MIFLFFFNLALYFLYHFFVPCLSLKSFRKVQLLSRNITQAQRLWLLTQTLCLEELNLLRKKKKTSKLLSQPLDQVSHEQLSWCSAEKTKMTKAQRRINESNNGFVYKYIILWLLLLRKYASVQVMICNMKKAYIILRTILAFGDWITPQSAGVAV